MAGVSASREQTPSSDASSASISPSSATDSCRKKKSEGASLMQDVIDHLDEFVHASMDEHKKCFHKTMSKMFGLTKVVQSSSPVESVLELTVTTSES